MSLSTAHHGKHKSHKSTTKAPKKSTAKAARKAAPQSTTTMAPRTGDKTYLIDFEFKHVGRSNDATFYGQDVVALLGGKPGDREEYIQAPIRIKGFPPMFTVNTTHISRRDLLAETVGVVSITCNIPTAAPKGFRNFTTSPFVLAPVVKLIVMYQGKNNTFKPQSIVVCNTFYLVDKPESKKP